MAKRGNGEGSIVKRKDGRWQASYSYNGKRKFIYGKTRNEFKDKLNKALVNIVDNKYVNRSNFTLNQIIKMNIEEQLASNKISAVTYKRKIDTLKIIETFSISELPIQQINSIILNEELLKINHYSNSVIIKVSQMIRNAFDKALILNIVK